MVDCHLDEGEVCFLGLGDWRPEIERKEKREWGLGKRDGRFCRYEVRKLKDRRKKHPIPPSWG